jgi:hypothetical protein
MCGCVHERQSSRGHGLSALLIMIALSTLFAGHLRAQSPSTGALIGRTLDPSGAAIPGAKTLSAISDEQGRFVFQLLAPGNYGLQAVKSSFDPLQLDDINISVTETRRICAQFLLQGTRTTERRYPRARLSAIGKNAGVPRAHNSKIGDRQF